MSQTRYRAALVSGWNIPAGASVLEVGCGQGDMTAVLAEAVGPQGRVVAVDIADPSYGAPVTLGQSAKHLKATPLGSRIDSRFGLDVLDETVTFPDGGFDHVVLAHCSWYFASLDPLRETLARVRRWARNLCFAEWDLAPRPTDQIGHRLRRGRRGGRPPRLDTEIYKQRNTVERCIDHLKQWRGLAIRCDKLAFAYQAALHLASILIWARR
ncbi:methyltransferase domain-containing protein [Streptomyces lavendulae]|uniref:class I SAM-dependent methyltransferase n=1 Tax=Streptomyces lavendulae TaxID=1914 RepID=UPI00367DCBB7